MKSHATTTLILADHGADDLLGRLLAQVDRVSVAARDEQPRAVQILVRDARRFAIRRSALIDRDAVMRCLVGQRVRRVPVFDELRDRTQDHVRAGPRLAP